MRKIPNINTHIFKQPDIPWRGWTPAQLNDLVGWWDASDTTTITEVTGVSNWADKSGNGNDFVQAVGADQPNYTGVGSSSLIIFDGVTENLFSSALATQLEALSNKTSGTFCSVMKNVTGVLNPGFSINQVADTNEYFYLYFGTDDKLYFHVRNGGAQTRWDSETVYADNTELIVTVTSTGSAWRIYVNGVDVTSSGTFDIGVDDGRWLSTIGTIDSCYLGATDIGSVLYMVAELKFYLIASTAITADQDVALHNYLNGKFSIY